MRDEECKKSYNQILAGLGTNETQLKQYLSTWGNYREIWQVNKDMFIKRYEKHNPKVSSFDADIARSDHEIHI